MKKGKKLLKGLLVTVTVLVIVAAVGVLLWYVAGSKETLSVPTFLQKNTQTVPEAETTAEETGETEGQETIETAPQEGETEYAETQEQATEETKNRETETIETETIETETLETETLETETIETETMETETIETEALEEAEDIEADAESTERSAFSGKEAPASQKENLWVSTAGGQKEIANELTGYETERKDFGLAQDQGPAMEAEFETLRFTGTNAERTDWLNKQLQQLETAYEKQVEEAKLEEKQQELAEAGFSGTLRYAPKEIASVYTEGSAASVAYSWVWYEEGIEHHSWDTLNVDTSTKQPILLEELLGLSLQEVQEQIIQGLQAQYGVSRSRIKQSIEEKTEFSYYFDEDSVWVCFDSYELGLPSADQQILLERKTGND